MTGNARLIRWSLLPGMLALTLVMLFGVDVVVETLEEAPAAALALTALALAAVSMAGAVLSTHAALRSEGRS